MDSLSSRIKALTENPKPPLFKIAAGLFVLVALIAGWLFGWMVGASKSPVVGAALPVFVTILTTIVLANLNRSAPATKLIKKLESLGEFDQKSELQSAIRSERSLESTTAGLLFGLLFLIMCWFGLNSGIRERVGLRPSEAMKSISQYDELRSQNKGVMINAYWRMRLSGITGKDDQEFLLNHLSWLVDQYLKNRGGNDSDASNDELARKYTPAVLKNWVDNFTYEALGGLNNETGTGNQLPGGFVPTNVR